MRIRQAISPESALEDFDQRLAEPRRRRRDPDARGFHGGDFGVRAALAAGADEYIMKPFDKEIVEAKFQEVGLI